MFNLIAASAFFLLIHFAVSGTRLRDALVRRLGEGPYRAAFALASIAGLAWMVYGYRHAPVVALWEQPAALRPLAFALVFVAFLFVVVGLATPSPTQVGKEGRLQQGADGVRGMLRITRHPFLWGVALWALVHVVMNGDLSSLILFGSLLVLALGGPRAIDAKRQRRYGDDWARFAAASSSVPFAAILGGRNRLGAALGEIGLVRLLAAALAYAVFFYFHGRFFGAPLM
jgi:uncharacterized membrane protein